MANIKVVINSFSALFSLLLIALIWARPAPRLELFPSSEDCALNIHLYTEMRYVANKATGRLVRSSDTIVRIDYDRRDERPGYSMKPVSGIEFTLQNDTLDFDRYEYVDILMKMENITACNVGIITAETVDSIAGERKSRYSEAVVRPGPDNDRYRIGKGEFDTPQWWRNRVGRANFIRFVAPRPDYSRVTGLRIERTTDGNRLVAPGKITVYRITFTDRKNVPLHSAATFIVVLLGLAVVRLPRASGPDRRIIRPDVPYTPIDIPDADELLTGRIIGFIGSHFQEDIKVNSVAKAEGCRHEQVSEMLERKSGMKFNQYLNHVRITEAKRLLVETRHTIAEIAFNVGYNNITNFNRIFRLAEGVAPREYRIKRKGAFDH